MKTQPLLSAIIPNYNYAHYLPLAINSVLAQSYKEVEIIVVDDGSKDDSRSIVRTYGERVRLIEQKNQGVAVARNRGVAESLGEFIAFLDADDLWLPTKLERQMQRFFDEPELGLVHCGVEEIDEEGNPLLVRLDGLEGWVAKELLLLQRPVILGGGSGLMISRKTFEEVGGFDERLSTSADWDFFYRVAARYRVGFVPEVLIHYRVHKSNMHSNVKLMEHDMLLAYSKAFSVSGPELERLRRQSLGNLHMVLAGSYFRMGKLSDFARHMLKSLLLTPGNCKHLWGFPLRKWQRERGSEKVSRAASWNISNGSR